MLHPLEDSLPHVPLSSQSHPQDRFQDRELLLSRKRNVSQCSRKWQIQVGLKRNFALRNLAPLLVLKQNITLKHLLSERSCIFEPSNSSFPSNFNDHR